MKKLPKNQVKTIKMHHQLDFIVSSLALTGKEIM